MAMRMNTEARKTEGIKVAPKPFTITAEAKAALDALREVEQTAGKDARKARFLAVSTRALLVKLSEASSAVKFLLEGKVSNR